VRVIAEGDGPPKAPVKWFDYGGVRLEHRREILDITAKIKASQKRLLAEVITIGLDLKRAKELLGHGHFGKWLQCEFRLSERTAQNYMNVAEHFGPQIRNVADLRLGAVFAVAKKSTPKPVREELMQRLERGETFSKGDVETATAHFHTEQREPEGATIAEQDERADVMRSMRTAISSIQSRKTSNRKR
jgi:Protein of unknown function (DUF3102)